MAAERKFPEYAPPLAFSRKGASWPETHSVTVYRNRIDGRNCNDNPEWASQVYAHNHVGFHKMWSGPQTTSDVQHKKEYMTAFGSHVIPEDAAPGRRLLFAAGARPKRGFGANMSELAKARSQPNFHHPPVAPAVPPPADIGKWSCHTSHPPPTHRPYVPRPATSYCTSSGGPGLLDWGPEKPSNRSYGFGSHS